MKKYIKYVSYICILFIAIILFKAYFGGTSPMEQEEKYFELNIDYYRNQYEADPDLTVLLEDLYYPWDRAYVFAPGTTKAQIEAITGLESNNIPSYIRNGRTQILFIRNTREIDKAAGESNTGYVACNIYGKKFYSFDFGEFDSYIELQYWKRPEFSLSYDGDIFVLTYIND